MWLYKKSTWADEPICQILVIFDWYDWENLYVHMSGFNVTWT